MIPLALCLLDSINYFLYNETNSNRKGELWLHINVVISWWLEQGYQRYSPKTRSGPWSSIVWSTVLPLGLKLDSHAACAV